MHTPQTAAVHVRAGKVQPLQEEVEDDTFLYDLCKRADMTWQNVQLDDMDPCALNFPHTLGCHSRP